MHDTFPNPDDRSSTNTDTDYDYEQHPNAIDPVRFYLRRDAGDEIVGIGCSFPFPHDTIVVAQCDRTACVETLAAARDVTGADYIDFLDADLAFSDNENGEEHPEEYVDLGDESSESASD